MTRAWLALLALLAPVAAHAEPAAPLALDDAVAQALAGEPGLVAAGWRVRAARGAVVAADGELDPRLELGVEATADRPAPATGALYQRLGEERALGYARLVQRLDGGAALEARVDVPLDRTRTRLDLDSGRVESEQRGFTPGATLGLELPLWGGRGEAARLPRRLARAGEDVAALELEAAVVERVRAVRAAYWDLVVAEHALGVRRDAVALARDQARLIALRIAGGQLPATALREADAAIALREDDVLAAELRRIEASLALRALAGLPEPAGGAGFTPTTPPPAAGALPAPDAVRAAALAASPDVRLAAARGHQLALDRARARAATVPRLDLRLRARVGGDDRALPTAVADLGGGEALRVDASLVYAVGLGGRAARGQADALAATGAAAAADQRAARAALARAVDQALAAIAVAGRRRALLARAVVAADDALAAERLRFDGGSATLHDVLARQAERADAELRRFAAEVDEVRARDQLDALTGALLAAHAIGVVRHGPGR